MYKKIRPLTRNGVSLNYASADHGSDTFNRTVDIAGIPDLPLQLLNLR